MSTCEHLSAISADFHNLFRDNCAKCRGLAGCCLAQQLRTEAQLIWGAAANARSSGSEGDHAKRVDCSEITANG